MSFVSLYCEFLYLREGLLKFAPLQACAFVAHLFIAPNHYLEGLGL